MITRRHAICLTTKGLAALMALSPHLSACRGPGIRQVRGPADVHGPTPPATEAGSIDWETFLSRIATLAEEQFSPTWNQETHVEEVIALMRMLNLQDAVFETLYDGYAKAIGTFPEIQAAHAQRNFKVVTLEFKPGDTIPLHNHPDMTGVMLCVGGRVHVEAFDLLERSTAAGKHLIRRTDALLLEPGDFAALTAQQGNIHTLHAREAAELLDIFTPPYDKERLTRYRQYARSDEPLEGDDVFEAWEV